MLDFNPIAHSSITKTPAIDRNSTILVVELEALNLTAKGTASSALLAVKYAAVGKLFSNHYCYPARIKAQLKIMGLPIENFEMIL